MHWMGWNWADLQEAPGDIVETIIDAMRQEQRERERGR